MGRVGVVYNGIAGEDNVEMTTFKVSWARKQPAFYDMEIYASDAAERLPVTAPIISF
jgi:hypothetical protein